jgi:adenosine deaminase
MLFVVCFVFCVCVLCCVCLRNYSIIFYFWDRQISKLCAAVNKEPPQKHTDSIRYVSVIQVAQNLTFTLMREWHCGAVKIVQKMY